jgi:uncharacterized protein YcfJ
VGFKRKLLGLAGLALAPVTGGASLLVTGAAVATRQTGTPTKKSGFYTEVSETEAVADKRKGRQPRFEVATVTVKHVLPREAQNKAAQVIAQRAKEGWEITSQSSATARGLINNSNTSILMSFRREL